MLSLSYTHTHTHSFVRWNEIEPDIDEQPIAYDRKLEPRVRQCRKFRKKLQNSQLKFMRISLKLNFDI